MKFETRHLNHKFILSPKAQGVGSSRSDQILVLVHGRGGRLPLMEFFSKRGRLAEFDFLLIEAPVPEFVPEMKAPGFSWYLRPNEVGLNESREKIFRTLSDLQRFGYSAQNIFWLGFSQGAVMGVDTALRGQLHLGGVVAAGGFCLNPEEYPQAFGPFSKQIPILATLGDRDEIVPPGPARKGFEQLQTLGVDLEIREYSRPHSFELRTEVPAIENWLIAKAGLSHS